MNLKSLLIIFVVMALGVLLINQSLGYFYKAQFLKAPCTLCQELNPHLEPCFTASSKYKINKLTGEIIGSSEVISELNKREDQNYTQEDWLKPYTVEDEWWEGEGSDPIQEC